MMKTPNLIRYFSRANAIQKNVLAIAVAVSVLMFLFPPYIEYQNYSSVVITKYGFLFDIAQSGDINGDRLLTQWIGTVVVALLAHYLFRDKSTD